MARKKSITKDEILDAVEIVLKNQGYQTFTQDAVIEAAGISKGGLVYTFPTKDGLIKAALERELQRFMLEVEKKAQEFKSSSTPLLLGYLKAMQTEDEEVSQKAFNLFAAMIHAPEALEVAQSVYKANMKSFFSQSNKELSKNTKIAFWAAEGLFFLKFTGLKTFTKKEWKEEIDQLINLIQD